MKSHTSKKVVYLMVLCLLILGSTGNAKRVNLIKDELVTVNKIDNDKFHFGTVYVYQKDSTLKISGKGLTTKSAIKGHVDIAITRPDGSIINTVSVPIRRKVHRRSQRTSAGRKIRLFSLTMPLHLPLDSKITIAFHRETKKTQHYFNCGHNIAQKISKNGY